MHLIPESYPLSEMEARRIYLSIFGRPIPPIVQERFIAASAQLDRTVSPQELEEYGRLLAACTDLEAVEVAGRYTRRMKLLSRKFRLMVYLAETLPENQSFFVNERSSFLAGLWHSIAGTIWTVLKVIKGLWLLKRNGIV